MPRCIRGNRGGVPVKLPAFKVAVRSLYGRPLECDFSLLFFFVVEDIYDVVIQALQAVVYFVIQPYFVCDESVLRFHQKLKLIDHFLICFVFGILCLF